MKKLIEFGRKAMLYVRLLSGYEERRIRNYRIHLHQRIQQAEAKKADLRKVPEQIILSELRRLVTEMQSLNKQLEQTEVDIQKHFNKIDKDAEMIMEVQLKEEEKNMKEMLKIMQTEACLDGETLKLNKSQIWSMQMKESINDKASSG